jgi:hypothetical protein
MALSGSLHAVRVRSSGGEIRPTVDWLRGHAFEPDTRLYATPNKHLVFTAYTGLPVQSVAPVRKAFLDSYPGEILLIETMPYRSIHPEAVVEAARRAGVEPPAAEVPRLVWQVTCSAMRERLEGRVAEVRPCAQEQELPAFLRPLADGLPSSTAEWMQKSRDPSVSYPVMFRGRAIVDHETWWVHYFYRFVGPERRGGAQLNYASRVRSARAWVFPAGVLYQVPRLSSRLAGMEPGSGEPAGIGPAVAATTTKARPRVP